MPCLRYCEKLKMKGGRAFLLAKVNGEKGENKDELTYDNNPLIIYNLTGKQEADGQKNG
jgi:hypothetical protein